MTDLGWGIFVGIALIPVAIFLIVFTIVDAQKEKMGTGQYQQKEQEHEND